MEYVYAIYAGRNGWVIEDTLYLIKPNGIVKKVKHPFGNKHFLNDNQTIKHMEWELEPGMILALPELNIDDIPRPPKRVNGMDGTMITTYDIKKEKIKELWSVEDYGQIEFYNLIKTAFRQQEAAMKEAGNPPFSLFIDNSRV